MPEEAGGARVDEEAGEFVGELDVGWWGGCGGVKVGLFVELLEVGWERGFEFVVGVVVLFVLDCSGGASEAPEEG